MPKQRKKKNLQNPPKRIPLGIKLVQNKEGVGFVPHIGVKSIPKSDVIATKENHVLGLPLTVST